MRVFIISAIFSLLVCAFTTNARATADGPDFWQVWNVTPGDLLNYRVGPGVNYPKLGGISHSARRITVIVCVPTTTRQQWFALSEQMQLKLSKMSSWCLIEHAGQQLGWVNRRFLTEDDE